MQDKPKCATCIYYAGNDNRRDGSGYCHRNAPQPSDVGTPLKILWPRTAPSDWCGEWANEAGESVFDVERAA